jgi:GrpB-like predicted nucleotidyltransferase (UPF0157 family)
MHKDLNELSREELGKLFPILIVDHDPRWKMLFHHEKKNIIKALGKEKILRLEHIGSTAVPDLKAKPTIDILIEMNENVHQNQIIEPLKKIGYQFIPKPENPPPHMMFAKGYSSFGLNGQTFHLHVRYKKDWDEIYFRDYLIDHFQVAEEYGQLKLELAQRYKHDREAYTDAKSFFIKKVLKKAKKK